MIFFFYIVYEGLTSGYFRIQYKLEILKNLDDNQFTSLDYKQKLISNKENILKQSLIFCDAPINWQYGFQDSATPIIEGIINFHHDLMFFIIVIIVFILWIILRIVYLFTDNKNISNVTHHTVLEVIWTIIPTIILIVIAIPSFALLYAIDEIHEPSIILKVIGRQWYWTYEYDNVNIDVSESFCRISDKHNYFSSHVSLESFEFDSYIVIEEDLLIGQFRLLEVDNPITVKINEHIMILVTSSDVLHSWAVPSLGIKMDACPGRLNQVDLFIKRSGTYYGQCSEICGINHSFIPIVINVIE